MYSVSEKFDTNDCMSGYTTNPNTPSHKNVNSIIDESKKRANQAKENYDKKMEEVQEHKKKRNFFSKMWFTLTRKIRSIKNKLSRCSLDEKANLESQLASITNERRINNRLCTKESNEILSCASSARDYVYEERNYYYQEMIATTTAQNLGINYSA